MRTTLALVWIVGISALDAWYTVCDGVSMIGLERNPIVSWLMTVGGMPAFVVGKVIGTSMVTLVVREMERNRYRWSGVIVTVLCMLQSMVLLSYTPRWL